MKRKIISLILIISGLSISLLATFFYLLNANTPMVGLNQPIPEHTTPSSKGQLTATFLGTSTLIFSDGDSAIMIDGFITRPTLNTLLWGTIKPDIALIKTHLKRLHVPSLDSIAVVHSHHDHAMDAPVIAQLTKATLFGSESTANIATAIGLPDDQIAIVDKKRTLRFGQFKVTMIKSKHSPVPVFLAWLTGHNQSISAPFPASPRLTDYKEGGSYAVILEHPLGNILVHASAGFTPDLLSPYQADYVFLGIAGLSKQSDEFKQHYFRETIGAVGAHTVIPIHWDNFMVPIGEGLVTAHPLIDNISQSISDLSTYINNHPSTSLTLMNAWESILLNSASNHST